MARPPAPTMPFSCFCWLHWTFGLWAWFWCGACRRLFHHVETSVRKRSASQTFHILHLRNRFGFCNFVGRTRCALTDFRKLLVKGMNEVWLRQVQCSSFSVYMCDMPVLNSSKTCSLFHIKHVCHRVWAPGLVWIARDRGHPGGGRGRGRCWTINSSSCSKQHQPNCCCIVSQVLNQHLLLQCQWQTQLICNWHFQWRNCQLWKGVPAMQLVISKVKLAVGEKVKLPVGEHASWGCSKLPAGNFRSCQLPKLPVEWLSKLQVGEMTKWAMSKKWKSTLPPPTDIRQT